MLLFVFKGIHELQTSVPSPREGKERVSGMFGVKRTDFKQMEPNETDISCIPGWHKDIVRQHLVDYDNNPEQALDFEFAMDDIEKAL